MSDKHFDFVTAVGDFVSLKVVKVQQDSWKQKNSGLYVPGSAKQSQPSMDQSVRIEYVVDSIGEGVENPSFKKGDKVVADSASIIHITGDDEEENIWALVKAENIRAVLS